MIPKKIHYCWFGGKPLPDLAIKCIESWTKNCPDYEIIQWNESNYDINKCKYMSEAYKEKKWGFVPDYARFDIIYHYGGFYLDTDVELIKTLDFLLEKKGVMGFESSTLVSGGLIIAGESGNPIIKEMYLEYENKSFYKDDGSLNLTPSPVFNTEVLLRHGLNVKKYREVQELDSITIFPPEYFCPKSLKNQKIYLTQNTISIHHYDGSWLTENQKRYWARKKRIYEIFPEKIGRVCIIPFYIIWQFTDFGLSGLIKHLRDRLR